MTPDTLTLIQIEKYRQMTGEQRLLIGLRLHELSCAVARDGIRARHPGAEPAFIEEQLRHRLRLAYANQNHFEPAND